MSLSIHLIEATATDGGSGIFARENGRVREITRVEWDERFPGTEPVVISNEDQPRSVFNSNITHNLGKMADEAGIYKALWRPDEIGITRADQLIIPLEEGLSRLLSDPAKFKALNPANGWGHYEGFVAFVEEYLVACRRHPAAVVSVSR